MTLVVAGYLFRQLEILESCLLHERRGVTCDASHFCGGLGWTVLKAHKWVVLLLLEIMAALSLARAYQASFDTRPHTTLAYVNPLLLLSTA